MTPTEWNINMNLKWDRASRMLICNSCQYHLRALQGRYQLGAVGTPNFYGDTVVTHREKGEMAIKKGVQVPCYVGAV